MKKEAGEAFRCAFPRTIPVMVGYLFLGMAYGILMSVNGFSMVWPVLISLIVFAGSLQYVGVTLLISAFQPATAFFMALMVNARHLFYGISMLGKYRDVKRFRPYLIFGLTDETFSVLCHEEAPKEVDRDWYYFWVTALDQGYWVVGTILGAVAGNLFTFPTEGLDFALTALFVVIFVDQWKAANTHGPALTGLICSLGCLLLFGQSSFIIPAMVCILAVVSLGYGRRGEEKDHE